MKYNKGYNLVELTIVVAIIAILITIAFPNYQQYMVNSRRSEAMTNLLVLMQLQESFFLENRVYTTDLNDLGVNTNVDGSFDTENAFYRITAAQCTGMALNRCITLTATPMGVQTGDNTLTLNSLGERTPINIWD
jgi:type IV pilus assembly protein PilE